MPYDDAAARRGPAVDAIASEPRRAVPDIGLDDGRDQWSPRRDLLASDRFAPEFVVETESDGRAYLRFGDDVLGRRPAPGSTLEAAYRVGGGRAGNVGPGALTRLVTDLDGILAVANPLPATGGEEPEPIERVRHTAPWAFRTQQRAVTEADYAEVAQRRRGVQRAAATRRWTGSWHTAFVAIDRRGGHAVDREFRRDVAAYLEPFRMAGTDVEIDQPTFVPLDIVLTVCVEPGYFRADVRTELLRRFGVGRLGDGSPGFFHPDNFTFGQPVFLSRIVATAMEVDGVAWVDTGHDPGSPHRFGRWGQLPGTEFDEGVIRLARLEIARLDNDPNAPENGRLEFLMQGGR
jgi:predicted phage baseplate assembly protein